MCTQSKLNSVANLSAYRHQGCLLSDATEREVAQSDLSLGYESDMQEGDIYQQLTWSIYARLRIIATEWLEQAQEQEVA